MTAYRNAEAAFLGELALLVDRGADVLVRGSRVRELVGRSFVIEHPLERCITVPHRLNNLAASAVETMWVLAGRNDISGLLPYLPRARKFSDDGATWRGGYGPRLRDWNGVDQVDEVRRLLVGDPTSRRGVISLFDPALDHRPGLDVPCNNWIHFIRRDGVLDLLIAVRSNDIMWGFSGINAFEWSVLHEMMAVWTDSEVGRQHWFVSSLHLYDRHYRRADAVLSATRGIGRAQYPSSAALFEGEFRSLAGDLEHWFALEARVRHGDSDTALALELADPLFRALLQVVQAYWAIERGSCEATRELRDALAPSDLAAAIDEYASRRLKNWEVLAGPSTSLNVTAGPSPVNVEAAADVKATLQVMHRMKSAAYGDSWKRRGELLGVLANIARKVDRLSNHAAWLANDPESQIDTISDLLLYLLKYQTFLADQDEALAARLFDGSVRRPISDGDDGLEFLLDRVQPILPSAEYSREISLEFESLLGAVKNDSARTMEKYEIVQRMSGLAFSWLLFAHRAPRAAHF